MNKDKHPNEALRYHRLLRGWSQQKVADEIGTISEMISKWERGQKKTSTFYQEKLCVLFGKNAEELGFLPPAVSIEEPAQEKSVDVLQLSQKQQPTEQVFRNPDTKLHPLSQPLSEEGTITIQALESDDEAVKRREATRSIGVFGLQLLGLPVWEHLSQALSNSSSLDKTTLEVLRSITENFWRLSETMAPSALINPVVGHFEMMAQFLRNTPPLALYQPLCSLASEAAQIAARLFFDMKGYKEATTCYNLSIELAHRANNPVLEVVGLTRKARDMLQNGYTPQAHTLLQRTSFLSSQPGASIANAYLAAVSAKALSRLNKTEACRQKLDEATQYVAQIQPGDDLYWTSFDTSLLNDFQGDCYLQLRRFSEAQSVFQDALRLSDSSSHRHRASIMVGLADALIQQGELEQSCVLVSNAVEFTTRTQSWMIFHYILTFRHGLEAWKNEACVRYLDEQIANLNTTMYTLKG